MTFAQTTPKPKACRCCAREFTPKLPMQAVCGRVCAQREQQAKRKAEREQTKQRKEALKRIPELIAAAQEAFNKFIRLRDKDKGCFVCGEPFPVGQLGGDFDAGHVRSRGAAGHLRFNEDNCHGECKPCNASWGAKPHEIEAGAIRRIGQERYDALKNNNTPAKWTKDGLRAIAATYKVKTKELKCDQ
jgi:5-methylcytosine-specific restriction endonuclease McrA